MSRIELKPCPFCGGEAELKEGNVYLDRCIKARCKNGCVSTKPILIDHPRMTFDGLDESTRYTEEQAKQEAAKIWNRRATKEQIEGRNVTENHPVDEFVCEKCGAIFREFSLIVIDEDDGEEYYYEFAFKFCPKCGMKVMGD